MVPAIVSIALTAASVSVWIAAICCAISSVARAVWPASDFTSAATTAKPRPASPARAASMVALSASRLVCSAMSRISETTLPMREAVSARALTRWLAPRAAASAWFTTWPVWPIVAAISLIEVDSSSEQAATDWTLREAAREASPARPASLLAEAASAVSFWAVASMARALSLTPRTTSPIEVEKSRRRPSSAFWRPWRASTSRSEAASRSRRSMPLRRNTSTECAMAPISSRRLTAGTVTS
ncbi:hypothetical protein ABB55_27600 [Prosthecomicrobium hirschii]|uniref:Uncharacterized protein n=1 Tax=Prosthecodimorpha hirschii TaxID=665126 RepID=A0A0P6VWJ3_9HYPH|nr:hypothetical protein ABB55_27600 [Prosthecomicrobium hirschii]